MSLSLAFGGVRNKFFAKSKQVKPADESNSKSLLGKIAYVSARLKNKVVDIATTNMNAEIILNAAQALTQSVKSRIQHLRTMSREDRAWAFGTVGLGMVAKTVVLSASGLASGGSTLIVAAVGGATLGLVKSGISVYRDYKKNDEINPAQPFWSTKTLMTTVSHAALSTATAGAFEAIEMATGINVGQKIAEGVGHVASQAFNKAATAVKITESVGLSLLKALTHFIPNAGAAELVSTGPVATPRMALPSTSQILPTVVEPSTIPSPITQDIARAREIARQMATAVATAKTPEEVAHEAIRKASSAVAQDKLTDSYTKERLHKLILDTTGMVADKDATVSELARQFYGTNSDAFLKGIQQQAPQIKIQNLAGSCTTAIPNKPQSTHIVSTICHKFKAMMAGTDIVVVEDTNNPDPKAGVQVYHRGVVPAPGGVETPKSTQDFMMDNITGPNGDIPYAIENAVAKLAEIQPQ